VVSCEGAWSGVWGARALDVQNLTEGGAYGAFELGGLDSMRSYRMSIRSRNILAVYSAFGRIGPADRCARARGDPQPKPGGLRVGCSGGDNGMDRSVERTGRAEVAVSAKPFLEHDVHDLFRA
jgi:hypothetical protein